MKNVLILLALAGMGASACGGDDGGDKTTTTPDASVKGDAGSRPQQIDNGKVGAECTTADAKTSCSGVGGTCLTTQGQGQMSLTFPGGYCSATCQATAECGTGAACPVADIIAGLPSTLQAAAAGLTGIIPSNCYKKCTANSDCRDGYSCASLTSAGGGLGGGGATGGIDISMFLGAAADATYCFPPLPVTDGGVGTGDAGAKALTITGLDAGL